MLKQLTIGQDESSDQNHTTEHVTHENEHNKVSKNVSGFNINAVFIVIQTVCSCFAGVYNEHLLKNAGASVNIYIQNIYMYLDSIVCNSIILLLQGNLFGAFTSDSLASIFRFDVILIMFNNAAIGIVTSFFLKHMNSILKTFASALELLFTAVLCYILFSIPIYLNTLLAIGIVSFSTYLYSQNPVVNSGVAKDLNDDATSRKKLLSSTSSDFEDV